MTKHPVRGICLLLILVCLLPMAAHAKQDILLDVEPLYQEDYPEVLFTFRDKERSVSSSGCGAVCVSMVMDYFVPELEQTPATHLVWAYENEYYRGNGLNSQTLATMLKQNGVEGRWIGEYPKQIYRALKEGKPIIALMGEGIFTSSTHYVVICGMDKRERLYVLDPNSRRLSKRWYPMQTIFDQTGSDHAFMICQLPEEPEEGEK